VDDDVAPGSGPGNTRGDKGAIGRYMERYGPGLHHLALKTADIDAALAVLAEQGMSMIDLRGRPGSRRARIGFIHPRSLSGVLVHLVERNEL
jgi:methylmalonyl-CoA/ethylmalonyl-CoA epimerase